MNTGLGINLLVRLGEITNHSFVMPLVIFYPTSRCNSRCVSCEWWRSTGEDDLLLREIEALADDLQALGTRVVAFSGGEPLLRPDLFDAARLFSSRGLELELLTSGVLLKRHAREVAATFRRVTISLDAVAEPDYEAIRGLPALATIGDGVEALEALAPQLPIVARATLHRMNFRQLPALVAKAKAMRLDGISFLAADLSSSAFGRMRSVPRATLALDAHEVEEFERVVETTIRTCAPEIASGFLAESPAKLRRLPQYYAALLGGRAFPPVSCNAPWVSLVVEADGSVRPCFFHPRVASIREKRLAAIVRDDLPRFRQALRMETDAVCQRCVCSIKVGLGDRRWA